MMLLKSLLAPALLVCGLVAAGLSAPALAEQRQGLLKNRERPQVQTPRSVEPPQSNSRRFEQDAARRAMLDGHVMPFSVIKRRVEREMDGANYLGSEFDDRRGEYRLKYMRDGRVVWVDVDGSSGDIVRRSR